MWHSSNSAELAELAASLSTVCLSAVLLAPAGVGSRRARHAAPGGADDPEDVFVELASEAGFEWCMCYFRGCGAVRVWPWLMRWRRERRRRASRCRTGRRAGCEGPATDFGLLAAVLKCLQERST